jgi:N-acetylmuramoyl-L-alanine amidase
MVVDPGHGGRDSGVRVKGAPLEKELTLTLARELRDEARSMGGFQVRLTREEDETFPWARRRGAAEGAEIWIALHVNADMEGKARGSRVFYPREPSPEVIRGPQKTADPNAGAILDDMARIKRGNENVLLAEHLQRALDAFWAVGSRSSKPALLPGLGELDCPAVLVEVGFLTHAADQKTLLDPARRRLAVKAILRGIRSFVEDPRRVE